jgi:hypothetical protein
MKKSVSNDGAVRWTDGPPLEPWWPDYHREDAPAVIGRGGWTNWCRHGKYCRGPGGQSPHTLFPDGRRRWGQVLGPRRVHMGRRQPRQDPALPGGE